MSAMPVSVRGSIAVVLTTAGVALSLLTVGATAAAGSRLTGPVLGLALAAGVWWALHRLCTAGSRRAERLALGGVLLLALAPLLHSRLGLIASMPAVLALAGGFALTPRPFRERSRRRGAPELWLAAGALAWSLLLIIAAVALPLYSGMTESSTGHPVETSATIFEVNGGSALIAVSVPAVLCGLACLLLLLASHHGSRVAHRAAWVIAGLLAAFAFITGFSIGFLVLPAAIALLAAVAVAPHGGGSGRR